MNAGKIPHIRYSCHTKPNKINKHTTHHYNHEPILPNHRCTPIMRTLLLAKFLLFHSNTSLNSLLHLDSQKNRPYFGSISMQLRYLSKIFLHFRYDTQNHRKQHRKRREMLSHERHNLLSRHIIAETGKHIYRCYQKQCHMPTIKDSFFRYTHISNCKKQGYTSMIAQWINNKAKCNRT